MRGNDRTIIVAAVLVMLTSLGFAGRLMSSIDRQRVDLQLTANEQITRNLKPEYAVPYMALGAFRGFLINLAWVRIEQMKQDGEFQELEDLSDIVTKLQPRSPHVWSNRAWNLSYNVSVMTHSPQERWHWVMAGIKLLRDEGIPNNPNAILLYKELGWTFLHKIGMDSDDVHRYYKAMLAKEWHMLLGEPPNGTGEEIVAAFRPIAEVYDKYINTRHLSLTAREELRKLREVAELKKDVEVFSELPPQRMLVKVEKAYAQYSGSEPQLAEKLKGLLNALTEQEKQSKLTGLQRLLAGEPELEKLVDRLAKLGYNDAALLDGRLMDDVGLMLAKAHSYNYQIYEKATDKLSSTDEKLAEIFNADPLPADNAKLLAFLRAQTIYDRHKMDPLWMLELMEGYWFVHPTKLPELQAKGEVPICPIDWRNPGAHGLYWSALGVRKSEGIVAPEAFDLLNTDRQVLHGLQSMMHSGRLIYDPFGGPESGFLTSLPAYDYFIDAYHYAVMAAPQRIKSERVKGTTAIESFEAGHENALIWAVQMIYYNGETAKAEKYYKLLRDTFSFRVGVAKNEKRYQQPLEQFVNSEFMDAEMGTDRDVIQGYLNGVITQGLVRGILGNRPDIAQRCFESAKKMHQNYQTAQEYRTLQGDDKVNRMQLLPFNEIMATALKDFITRSRFDLFSKAKVWEYLSDVALKQMVYDYVKPRIRLGLKGLPYDAEKMFPEPPGMEEYRAKNAAKYKDVKTGELTEFESEKQSGKR